MDEGFGVATMLTAAVVVAGCLVSIAAMVTCAKYGGPSVVVEPVAVVPVVVVPAWRAVQHPAGEVVVGEQL